MYHLSVLPPKQHTIPLIVSRQISIPNVSPNLTDAQIRKLNALHHAQFRVCQNAQISDIRVDIGLRMALAEIQRFRIAGSDVITLNI